MTTDNRKSQSGDGGQDNSSHLRTLLDHTADSLFFVDASNGHVVDVNRHACETLGYSRDELLSMSIYEVDLEAGPADHKHKFWDQIQSGIPATFQGTQRRKDGSIFPVEVRCDLIVYDGTRFVLGAARDISDRIRAEKSLLEKEQNLRSLITSMSEGLCVHELVFDDNGTPIDYRILDVNPAYERILNIRREEVIGRLASETYQTGTAPYLDEYSQVALTGKPTTFETYFPPLDRHFSISAFSPAPNRFATVFMDVTERKQTELERQQLFEELATKNAELERFTYTVSHDLKSPLITIQGYLSLFEEDFDANDAKAIKEDLQRVTRATETMAQLLDELLELSRIGRAINSPEPIALDDLMPEVREHVSGRLAQTGITVDIAGSLPIVHGDRRRILEVFQNLIDNAAKYMGSQPNPRIEIGSESRDGETLLFVRDNGIGIEPQFHERVFDLFDQIDPNAEGTGIGLSLVKRIVEIHGGQIWVESDGIDTGSTFYLTLPGTTDDR